MSGPNIAPAGRDPAGPGFTYNKVGGYGILLAKCNCCGGMLHLNITRHGYVTLDCEDLGIANGAPCRHARRSGKDAREWAWKCTCPDHELDRACPNRNDAAMAERTRIQGLIEAAIYTAAMSRQHVVIDLQESDYVDFEPAVVDAVNMSFTIDGVQGQRPYHVLVRRYYLDGENISSRFVFFKKTIARAVFFRYTRAILSLAARLARRLPALSWIGERYEVA